MFFSNRKMQVTYLSEFTGPISPPVSIFKVYRVNIFNKVIFFKVWSSNPVLFYSMAHFNLVFLSDGEKHSSFTV